MPDQVNSLPPPELTPVPPTGQAGKVIRTGDGYAIVPDQLTTSKEAAPLSTSELSFVTTADQPNPYPPKKVSSETIKDTLKELKKSSWFAPTFLATFIAVMQDIANYERLTHLQEGQIEIKMRDYLFQLAKTTSELTKALYEKQSYEKVIEAFSNFASAAVSGVQFVQSTRNLGVATKKVEDRITAKQNEIQTEKDHQRGVITTDEPDSVKRQQKLTELEQRGYSDKVKKLEKQLANMEDSRDSDIQRQLQHEDETTRHFSDTLKQTIQGVGAFIQSRIKLEEGEIESLKQLTEGYIQAFNKYSETSARARDDAKQAFDREYDFTNRIVESSFKLQSLSHSG